MAASYKKTAVKTCPRVGDKVTSDTLYWSDLEVPITKKEYGAITHIDFSPVEPYNYAVTNSTRVQIYSSRTNQIVRTISRFREVAYSGSYRGDGKLLIAGGDEGYMKLFDTESRSLLRVFKGHTGPVHVTKFTTDKSRAFSGGDDCTLRIWDIAAEQEISNLHHHKDYIRCGAVCSASPDIIVSGSYDHTVRMHDTRTPDSILSVDHGHPVESVLLFPSGGIFISAGGTVVKVWDALAGGRLLTQFSHHHKTITSLQFCSNYNRLLSASLDRHVKIYDVSTYQVVHTLDYSGAILSVAVAPDDKVVVAGMAEGHLTVQHRNPNRHAPKKKRQSRVSYKYSLKGKVFTPSKDALIMEHKRREILSKYDKYLKRFEYSRALDAALDLRVRMQNPEITVSVMQELIRRGGIRAALAGRNERSLGILLKFIQKNICNQTLMPTLSDIVNLVLDLYSPQLGELSGVEKSLLLLKDTIASEVAFQESVLELMGAVDTLLSASATSPPQTMEDHAQVNNTPAPLQPSSTAKDS